MQASFKAFILQAQIGGSLQTGFTFAQPITITIEYSDADIAGLVESNLGMYYLDTGSGTWNQDGITLVSHDLVNNRIVFLLSHLTQFAMFGEAEGAVSYLNYLPLILK